MAWGSSCAAGARCSGGCRPARSGRTRWRCSWASSRWSGTTCGDEWMRARPRTPTEKTMLPILTLLVVLPLAGSVLVLLLGRDRDSLVRQVALGISLVTFALSLVMWWWFNPQSA